MEFQDEIRKQQELRKANISNSFESVRGTDIEKGKWKLGDIDPKYPNYFVAELKPNGSPVWKSKNKHSSHPALGGKKADEPTKVDSKKSVDPNTQKYMDKLSDQELEDKIKHHTDKADKEQQQSSKNVHTKIANDLKNELDKRNSKKSDKTGVVDEEKSIVDLAKKLEEHLGGIWSDKNGHGQEVFLSEDKKTLMIHGGEKSTHPYRDGNDARKSKREILDMLKKYSDENFDVTEEDYDPGSEKGWTVTARQFKVTINKPKKEEEEKVDLKTEVISKLGANFKERNYKSPSGDVMAFSNNSRGLEEQVEFTIQPDGQVYVYLFRKKEVSSRSLADPKAKYQTTSARVVKHETKKVRKYVDSQEKALKELDKFLKTK